MLYICWESSVITNRRTFKGIVNSENVSAIRTTVKVATKLKISLVR